MKNFKFLALIIFVAGCSTPPPTSNEVEKPEPPKVIDATAGRKKLMDIATTSGCEKTVHQAPNSKGKMIVQGSPPLSFLKGIAQTYVHMICNRDSLLFKTVSQPLGDASKDALVHLGLKPISESQRIDMTYSLVVGSVAFESSWRWCVGRDTLAKASDVEICLRGDGSTCESGYGQTSSNSLSNPVLRSIFDQFAEYPDACFANDYKGKTTCSPENMAVHGSGAIPRQYQLMSKECPGFAVESHLAALRVIRTHYGPINIKQAQAKPQCTATFEKLREAIVKDPSLCFVL